MIMHPKGLIEVMFMPSTYLCDTCGQQMIGDRPPVECPHCQGRKFSIAPSDAFVAENPYAAPTSLTPPPGSGVETTTAFSLCFWGGFVALLLTGVLMGISEAAAEEQGQASGLTALVIVVGLIALGTFIAAYVLALMKVYRAWKLIQPLRQVDPAEATMPTPGTAVGLLFVPFYNFYWIFVAYYGLMTRANKFFAWRRYQVPPAKATLAQWFCILSLVGMVPYLGACASLPNIVLMYLLVLEVNRIGNVIATDGQYA
jgi:hypothetical protein